MLADLEIQELAFPSDAVARLAHVRAETGRRMPDCCVLLAAENAGARLATFDEQLTKAATARHLDIMAD